MTEKILTVIIPMYNAKPWISQCMRSLLIRTKERHYLEALIINDGSTDGCEKIAEKIAAENPDIFRIIHKKNGGHGSAVNMGIRESKGKYIKILDADDWLLTEELEKFIRELRGLKEPDLILCGYQTFHVVTGQKQTASARAVGKYVDMGELTAHWSQYRAVCTFHGIVYRTDFYRQNSGNLPEKVFYDDGYYSIIPASHAQKIYLSKRILYVYRIGGKEQSVSAENRVRRLKDAKRVITAICATIHEPRTLEGQKYWQLRTLSFIADYFVTCFLRFPDRKAGRLEAWRFMRGLGKKYPELAGAARKRYWLLRCMGYMHINEEQFQKLVQIRGKGKNFRK